MRLAIMTVGKTHSGKTTFANQLAEALTGSVVIDQDLQAEFLNRNYPELLPDKGPNTIKYALTQTLVEHAIRHTGRHLIISNSNLGQEARMEWLDYYRRHGFTTVLVFFNIPEDHLRIRIRESGRSTKIFRVSRTFDEVLDRQNAAYPAATPDEGDADHLFTVRLPENTETIIKRIAGLAAGERGTDDEDSC
ncbi:putative kinase [Bhargavaea cecembensis DSE10]|uniref:Putative kinase n=1 Tax=Bhargavaea cecembensis DSE10 TaxID=1235279 RepID=M7NX51_9BACL|nr:ATP-binding protein [Bhargavaea cecembensis]EMR06225.1 putative kinase [Bhargavaea cecembensis DSE10]